MSEKKFRISKPLVVFGILFVLSLVLILISSLPPKTGVHQVFIPEMISPQPGQDEDFDETEKSIGGWLVEIQWPEDIRAGNSGRISLIVHPAEQELSEQDGRSESSDSFILSTDIYDTHQILLAARLDLPTMDYSPKGMVQEPFLGGERASFYWGFKIKNTGIYRGNLWVYVLLLPKSGGVVEEFPLIVYPIQIQAENVLGMSAGVSRSFGILGLAVSLVSPLFLLRKNIWDIIGKKILKPDKLQLD